VSDTSVTISGEYFRSLKGDVIHLAPCPRMGNAVRWNYADGRGLRDVAAEVNASEWMRLCRRCWPSAAYPVVAGKETGQ
jgi:hypothetical protein